jgi:hypothetical protein
MVYSEYGAYSVCEHLDDRVVEDMSRVYGEYSEHLDDRVVEDMSRV